MFELFEQPAVLHAGQGMQVARDSCRPFRATFLHATRGFTAC